MQTIGCRASFGKEYAAYKNIQQTDYITRHQIYNRVLEMLSNPQIRHRQSGKVFHYVLHEKTKNALLFDCEFSKADVDKLEAEIFEFAENYAANYEVVRDAPAALFHDLKQTGETGLIFTKRAVPLPRFILNAFICEALEKEFTRSEILGVNGFCWRDGCVRLDLDENFVGRGFLVPIVDEKLGFINALRVFRHPRDEYPFVLRTRKSCMHRGVTN